MNPCAESYYEGLNRVFEYIDSNLAENLSLEVLCTISGYSGYHFHRLFHAVTGKTLHDYVLDRRMASVAAQLLYSTGSLTQLALDGGFSSSSSFSRAFKKYYGCSPSEYKKKKERQRPIHLAPKTETLAEYEHNFSLCYMYDLCVAGIVNQGLSKDFVSQDIERAFNRLFAWLKAHDYVHPGLSVLGATLDTPEVVPLAECRYFACVLASEQMQPEGEVSIRTLPTAGNYISFSLERSQPAFAEKFFRCTQNLYRYYLPEINRYPDNRPFLEFYRQNGPSLQITFYVPVK